MLPEKKLLLDPAISMVLFNGYIPLRRPEAAKGASEPPNACAELSKRLDGLFLGAERETPPKEPDGLFLRSEGLPVPVSKEIGLFIRSGDEAPKLEQTKALEEDWVIA
jgi:hypothetical protein